MTVEESDFLFLRLTDANREGLLREVVEDFLFEIQRGSTVTQAINDACWEWDI